SYCIFFCDNSLSPAILTLSLHDALPIFGGSPADEEIFPAGVFAHTSGIPARRGLRLVLPVVRTSVPISPASAIDLGVRLDLNPEERHPHPFPYLVDHVLCLVTRCLDQDFVVNHADDV